MKCMISSTVKPVEYQIELVLIRKAIILINVYIAMTIYFVVK